jgi:predicted DCC family thiol-disulfide oxidoreductase YuxK
MALAVLLYDQDCGFCRWTVSKILSWDRGHRLRAVPLHDPEADRHLAQMDPGIRMRSWHLVSCDGSVYSAGAVFDPLLRLLPFGRPLAALARKLPRTTDRIYGLAAENRDSLGSRVGAQACSVNRGHDAGDAGVWSRDP